VSLTQLVRVRTPVRERMAELFPKPAEGKDGDELKESRPERRMLRGFATRGREPRHASIRVLVACALNENSYDDRQTYSRSTLLSPRTHDCLSLRIQPQVIEATERTPEHVSARLHSHFPSPGIDVEALHDRWQRSVDVTALIMANRPPRPIHKLQCLRSEAPLPEPTITVVLCIRATSKMLALLNWGHAPIQTGKSVRVLVSPSFG
jgi:hypothetical protein